MNNEYNLEYQHSRGKLHAIERIYKILDRNSFHEIGREISNCSSAYGIIEGTIPYDGVITGYGMINNKKVYIYSQDYSIKGGTVGLNHGRKIANLIDMAIETRCPIIGINDSGGARIQEGVEALEGYGKIFYQNTRASGIIPQISIVAGPCAGGAVYSPAITDFIFIVEKISNMFIAGPDVVKRMTGSNVSADELGGVPVHTIQSGVAHFCEPNEEECYRKVRKLIQILPSSCFIDEKINDEHIYFPKKFNTRINHIVPENFKKAYDMTKVICEIFDNNSFLEVHDNFATNIIVGFAKLCSITVGIVANQPKILAGALDCNASDKAARFIRFCDCYNIPIISLVDVPGFWPGVSQEKEGIIRHGAKLLYAYSEATTIKLTVVIRKAYGGAYLAMGSKALGSDFLCAWESAKIAVMGAESAVDILYKKQMQSLPKEEQDNFRDICVHEYEVESLNIMKIAKKGYVDEVIQPLETREKLFNHLLLSKNKKQDSYNVKKHGNIPL